MKPWLFFASCLALIALTIAAPVGAQQSSVDWDRWYTCTDPHAVNSVVMAACKALIDTGDLSAEHLRTARIRLSQMLLHDADAYLQEGKYEKSCASASSALEDLSLASGPAQLRAIGLVYMAACNEGQERYFDAIAYATSALQTDSSVAVDAYRIRGISSRNVGKDQDAYNDLTAAIALDSSNDLLYAVRSASSQALGHFDEALADIEHAIALKPDNAHYRQRGELYFDLGRYADAIADLRRVVSDDPAYVSLWIYLAQAHLHENGAAELLRSTSGIDKGQWPAPVFALYTKHLSAVRFLQIAGSAQATNPKGQQCEAVFYLGELQLLQGRTDAARSNLKRAAATCPPAFIERAGALGELSRLR